MTDNARSRLCGMLGLAMRGGKVTVGTELVCTVLAKRKATLVILSSVASDGTKKKIKNKCAFYETALYEVDIDIEELGRLLGKTYAPAAVAVTDIGFAKAISAIIDGDK